MGGVYRGWGRRVGEGSRKEAGVRVDFIPEKCSGIRKTRVDRANASQMYDREVVGSFRETGLGFFSLFFFLSLRSPAYISGILTRSLPRSEM